MVLSILETINSSRAPYSILLDMILLTLIQLHIGDLLAPMTKSLQVVNSSTPECSKP